MIILSFSVTKNIDLGPERNVSINVSYRGRLKLKGGRMIMDTEIVNIKSYANFYNAHQPKLAFSPFQ